MLENSGHRSNLQDTDDHSLRKTRSELFRSFFSNIANIPRRLFGMGRTTVPRRLDEKISNNVSTLDKTLTMAQDTIQTRETEYTLSHFEWVKTERAGDSCRFKNFEVENDVEYVVFQDNSRIRTSLIGDVVLMHKYEGEMLGAALAAQAAKEDENYDRLTAGLAVEEIVVRTSPEQPTHVSQPTASQDPVVAILEKTKKKTEKITLTLQLKIPSPELYNVIKENFDNTDEILLQSVMAQIENDLLKDALKKELQNIYQKKKKP